MSPFPPAKKLDSAVASFLLRKHLPAGDAEAELREAIASGMKRVGEDAANYLIYEELVPALNNLGHLMEESSRPAEALAAFDQAVALGEPWSKVAKQPDFIRDYIGSLLRDSARMLDRLGRPAEAARRIDRALAIADEPDRPELNLKLAAYLRAAGNLPAAREAAERAADSPDQGEEARTLIEQIDAEVYETSGGDVGDEAEPVEPPRP